MKEAEADDPMELVCEGVPGETEFLARCVIEEFAQIGRSSVELFELFSSPVYPMLNAVLRTKGKAFVRDLIHEVIAECGIFKVNAQIIHVGCEGDD